MSEPMLFDGKHTDGRTVYYVRVCPYDTYAPNEWAYIHLDGSGITFSVMVSGEWVRYVDEDFDRDQISDLIGRFRTRTGIRDYIKEKKLKGQVDHD